MKARMVKWMEVGMWCVIVVLAVWLRMVGLGERPMHADEATGARIVARVLEGGGYEFNPKHFHGPMQVAVVAPICWVAGQRSWEELQPGVLRMGAAVLGVWVVGSMVWWRRRVGVVTAVAAAVALASSGILVYYSRMMIHEMGLVAAGMAVLAMGVWDGGERWQRVRWYGVGIGLGVMYGFKESVVISAFAWGVAGAWVLVERELARGWRGWGWLKEWRMPMVQVGVAGLVVSVMIYTQGFRDWSGWWKGVVTMWQYQTGEGHEKAWWYYLYLMGWPKWVVGRYWTEGALAVLAVLAYFASFREADCPRKWLVRFLAYAVVVQWVVYSVISYKTPWLVCMSWAQVGVLAGCGFGRVWGWMGGRKARVAWVVVGLALGWLSVGQARVATGRLASDERNPYAYVPTQKDVERVGPWLKQVGEVTGMAVEPIAVVGSEYWPLPWYLRGYKRIGYWPEWDEPVAGLPVVMAMADQDAVVAERLKESHVALPRGLRAGAGVTVYIKQEIWNEWIKKP